MHFSRYRLPIIHTIHTLCVPMKELKDLKGSDFPEVSTWRISHAHYDNNNWYYFQTHSIMILLLTFRVPSSLWIFLGARNRRTNGRLITNSQMMSCLDFEPQPLAPLINMINVTLVTVAMFCFNVCFCLSLFLYFCCFLFCFCFVCLFVFLFILFF